MPSKIARSARRLIGSLLPWRRSPSGGLRKRQLFSIGIYKGESPFDLVPLEGVENPVLERRHVSDAAAVYVADPFMIRVKQTWYMFFEVMNGDSGRGEIGLATSGDGMRWTYQRIVLTEPFHISYPYVFEFSGDYYMVPESSRAGCIRLYVASEFPDRWTLAAPILRGPSLSDPSIFCHEGKWWLFAETNPEFKFDTLRLYHADDLMGPWFEHRASPVVRGDARSARPAGRVLIEGGRVVRFAQDCVAAYGTAVRAFEVVELTTRTYREREVLGRPVLCAGDAGWNAGGMHHLDPHRVSGGWLACVDGWSWVDV